jgi:hypothetical protein
LYGVRVEREQRSGGEAAAEMFSKATGRIGVLAEGHQRWSGTWEVFEGFFFKIYGG